MCTQAKFIDFVCVRRLSTMLTFKFLDEDCVFATFIFEYLAPL
ncbi:hypothetical protein CKA32_007100 [Geitlerinema sp. FC II]|nr:hypothetical protein CKA32_007100 [Geitlerinema sp. FC II]